MRRGILMKKPINFLYIFFLLIVAANVSATCDAQCDVVNVCTEYTPGYSGQICSNIDYWYECDGIQVTPTVSTKGDASISNFEVVGCECVVYTVTNTRSEGARSYYYAYDTTDGSKGSTAFTPAADSIRREQIQWLSFGPLGDSQYEANWTFYNALSGRGYESSAALDCYMPGCGNGILDDGEECEWDGACLPTGCDHLDQCIGMDFYDYEALPNTCTGCACTQNQCTSTIHTNSPQCPCQADADCDDNIYCNGMETCQFDGSCIAGSPIDCDDNVGCTDDTCNEGADSCDNIPSNLRCDDGNACTTDACNPVNDCQYSNNAQGIDCGICAACDGLGSCVFDATQVNDCTCPSGFCFDQNDDGVIDAWNGYNVGTCQDINTCAECALGITEPDRRCQTAMKIPLEQYVSMFSLPLIPDTPVTFNDIQSGCTFRDGISQGIAAWNPLNTGADKYVYLDADTILYPGQGYFTTQEYPCEFTIQGYKFKSSLLGYQGTNNIYNGWNMIGSPTEGIKDFDQIEGICNVISGPWGFDAPGYQFVRTQKLEPGKGYFIKTTNDCSLI